MPKKDAIVMLQNKRGWLSMGEFWTARKLTAAALVCLGAAGCSAPQEKKSTAPTPTAAGRSSVAPAPPPRPPSLDISCVAKLPNTWHRANKSEVPPASLALAAESLHLTIQRINSGRYGYAVCPASIDPYHVVDIAGVPGTDPTCTIIGYQPPPAGKQIDARQVIALCPAPA